MIRQLGQVDDAVNPIFLAASANGNSSMPRSRWRPARRLDGRRRGLRGKGVNLESSRNTPARDRALHLFAFAQRRQLVWRVPERLDRRFRGRARRAAGGPQARIQHQGMGRIRPAGGGALPLRGDDAGRTAASASAIWASTRGRLRCRGEGRRAALVSRARASSRCRGGAAPPRLPSRRGSRVSRHGARQHGRLPAPSRRRRARGDRDVHDAAGGTRRDEGAAIKISPDGRWVLASNRWARSVAAYSLDAATGRLELKAISKLGGVSRGLRISRRTASIIVVANKLSNEVAVYASTRGVAS